MCIQALLIAAAVNLKRLATALPLIVIAVFAPAFANSAHIVLTALPRIGRDLGSLARLEFRLGGGVIRDVLRRT